MSDIPSLQQRLSQPYQRETWQAIIHSLFPFDPACLFEQPQRLKTTHELVKTTHQLGLLHLPDGHTIALLEVETSNQVMLARNRVGLRNFVASYIDEAGATAVLSVFHQAKSGDWRLTYAARQTTLDEDTFEITTVETAPRRFTFLLGKNEPCRTAASRLATLLEKADDLTLTDVEKAFSVEALSKDFFKKYKLHYQAFVDHLLTPARVGETREIFEISVLDDDKQQDKADKPIRDFVKTLLGRLVFLHFLQKKGWLGCKAGTKPWIGGDPDFLQSFFTLAKSNHDDALFHSRYLCPLFFEALNLSERPGDVFPLTQSRLPYLNGGLFEEDSGTLRTLDFPPELFGNLLDFFGEYNFTIDENDPDDHEVGIDPEMLGHIFENLLEDNKDKGAFYTPKAIVSYMSRQSLLHYLQTHLGDNKELVTLLNEKDPTKHEAADSFVAQNRIEIVRLLDDVKICDPAIGSGAFPIGLLQEILWTRLALQPELNTPPERAKLKRRIIQHSIHGVDIDPGAIEIARLRFWLALVVDEDEPRPLPNLDYKIHRADSLIEYIRGEPIRLDRSPPNSRRYDAALAHLVKAKQELFTAQRIPEKRTAFFDLYQSLAELGNEIFVWMKLEADFTDPQRMAYLDSTARQFSQWIREIDAVRKEKVHMQETLLGILKHWFDDPAAPTFLWKLHFGEIMARGRFDIVIANPPYVRHETISAFAPLLKDRYKVAASRADLFIFFYEQAVNILRDGGVLTFITSNKYYRAAYGKKLRPFLTGNLRLATLIDFGDAPVFDAIAYASILIGTKTPAEPSHALRSYSWRPEDALHRLPQVLNAGSFEIEQSKLGADGWQLEQPVSITLLGKLRSRGTPLTKHVGGQFFYGIKTGLNEAFVIDGNKRAELVASDPKSAELIKPFLRGKDVKRWKVTHHDLYLITFPHGFHQQLEKYPAILKHLSGFEDKLKMRGQCTSSRGNKEGGQHHWLELDNNPKPEYLSLFESPKIIYPDIYQHQSFCYEPSRFYSTNTTYFIAKDDPSLCAILNSNAVEWFYVNTSNRIRGGYLRSFSNYIKEIPIPPASAADKTRLAELAEACAAAAKKNDSSSLSVLEAEINRIVYRLFDLSAEEIALIEDSLGTPTTSGRHGEPEKKEALLRRLRKLGDQNPYLSFEKIRQCAHEAWPELKDDTLRHYLSEAPSRGFLHDAGRGWYSSLSEPAVLSTETVQETIDLISGAFPLLDFTCWSTVHWNPWLRHQVDRSTIFLSCDTVSLPTVHDFLRQRGIDSRANPNAVEIGKNPLGPKTMVLRPRLSGCPGEGPIASVEQVLVDAWVENKSFNLFDSKELRVASCAWISRKRVQLGSLLRYLTARSGKGEDVFGDRSIIEK